VYDKTVRRRRAVLALLVACSLILVTAYFGESAGGGLHSVQRGVLEVVSPIQEVASRALKPFRDLVGWAGDTISAKGKLKSVKAERDRLRAELIAAQSAQSQNRELQNLLGLDRTAGLAATHPVSARVIGFSPTLWFATINIDKGSSDGIHVNQPVVAGDSGIGQGLIGKVTSVVPNAAQVTLITDHTVAVSSRVAKSRIFGVLQTAIGKPTDLLLTETRRGDNISPGDYIETAGTRSSRFESLFPPGIPIGKVTRVDDPGTDNQTVHVRPFVNMRRLEFVQVLTRRVNGNRG
jgi:rod shape-determining protein MreC